MSEINPEWALVFVLAITGLGIGYLLQQIHFAILALVSLSAKKGRELPVDPNKLVPKRLQTPAESTHIHFPRSMMPEMDPDELEQRRKRAIPD